MQKYIEMIKDADTSEEISRIVNIATFDSSLSHAEFRAICTNAYSKEYLL